MSAITFGGGLVHYEKLGRGRPVILVHGWIGSWRYWIPLMRQLQLKYAVYAVDLFGYGDSTKHPAQYSITRQIDLLENFMRELAIKKAAFVAHGLGAHITAEFASANPHRVARMMLVSAPIFEVGDLKNRPMPDQPRPLTHSNAQNPFPGENALDASDYTEQETRYSRPAGLDSERIGSSSAADVTVPSASQETLMSPGRGNIDQSLLRKKAIERGMKAMDGDATQGDPPSAQEIAAQSTNNPLSRALNTDSMTLLGRCFKRSDAEYDKLQTDIAKMDDQAMHFSAEFFDPGAMLDTLRAVNTPRVIIHGENDPIIPLPSGEVWDFVTMGQDDKVATVPLPGVRHFPMLEYEPFTRMVTSFLDTSSIKNLDMKERWRRRTR